MRGFLILLITLLDIQDSIPALTVFAGRAGQDTPVPQVTVGREDLHAEAAQTSVPMALDMQQSVVSTNEGGTGLGYSHMRIRGVPGSQTGVSLNGITLNGAEDGEVFWVNIPALGKYLGSLQMQRGLGTSACGPGSFGAGINMITEDAIGAPTFEFTAGDFGTTGIYVSAPLVYWHGDNGGVFTAGGSYSYNSTLGYIRNADADVHSALGMASWERADDRIALTFLFGQQRSGITWEGIPLEMYHMDPTYNPAGEYVNEYGSTMYYDNQTDNYRQMHFQLNWRHRFGPRLRSSTTFNYTDGLGYYEQFRNAFLEDGSNAVTRDALDNSLYVFRSDITWQDRSLALSGGIYASVYSGRHYGDVYDSMGESKSFQWYSNDALKEELDIYARAEWLVTSNINLYGEIQARMVKHMMTGPDEYSQVLDFDGRWAFANPRLGVSWRPSGSQRLSASAALAHREPMRSDIQASSAVKPETMLDMEAMYSFTGKAFSASAGLYAMEYYDMLLETGRINDAGFTVKENTPRAFRRGLELKAAYRPASKIRLDANLTLSRNRIRQYTAFLDNYDSDWNYLKQTSEEYSNTAMLLSPSMTAGAAVCWTPSWMNRGIRLGGKFVGKQYWDNTSSEDRSVPAYWISNLDLGHRFDIKGRVGLTVRAEVNNLFDRQYYAYAWVWRAIVDSKPYQQEGVFPQAPINGRLVLGVEF